MSVTETDKKKFSKSFYGSIDRKGSRIDGRVVSQLPAWRHEKGMEDLKEEIDSIDRKFANSTYRPEDKNYLQMKRKKLDARYQDIISSKPAMNAAERSSLEKSYRETGEKIAESLFTRDQMWMRTVSAHEELRRMKKPCIKIDPVLAELSNVKLDANGKATRDDALRAWGNAGAYLGCETNPENLRRISNHMTGAGRRNSLLVGDVPWHNNKD